MKHRPHIAVVGGGVTGLAAAHALIESGEARVTLLESGERLGGKVRSERLAGATIDVGAESLMTRDPAAVELCGELGIGGELVAPRATGTAVWARGALRELPGNVLSGLPGGVAPMLRAGILSPPGVARAALDLVLPATRLEGDGSVGELVRRRLGSQALDRLVDPLLGTIYAADSEELSLRATAPQLERLAREHRSLIRGLLAARPAPRSGPLFLGLPGGLERIVARLAERLEGADLRRGAEARRLGRAEDGRYLLEGRGFAPFPVDGAVIATPAGPAARLLAATAPGAAGLLRTVRYSSAVVVTLRYAPGALPAAGEAGFFVPRGERHLLGACTNLSAKWAHLAEGGATWLRCSVGRRGVPRALQTGDAELVELVAAELREALGPRGEPNASHVARWEAALPVYEPGHLGRVERIERELRGLPGVELAGAAYRGIGVPQCVAQGRVAAERALAACIAEPAPA
ncbi:MAG: protoporphyrinogen oxidase [Nitrososphaerota archaeon]